MLSLSLVTAVIVAPALVAAQTPPFKSPFQFSNPQQLDGKKCVTPVGGAAVAGATLVVAECTNSAAQQITWTGTQVKSGNLCWTAQSGSGTVSLATCNSSDGNQSWYFNKFGGRQVKHNPTGRCLNVASAAANTPVTVTTCGAKYAPPQTWNPYYQLGTQPAKAAADSSQQFGTNQCGTNSTTTANCQNIYINDINDFCIFAPPSTGSVGDLEHKVVSYCLKSGRGTRTIPDGTFKGLHFVKTSTYVQLSGVGDFTKVHISAGDSGGELDPHGATAMGNPIGGLVYGNVHGSNVQYHEWSSFISSGEFCMRACLGGDAAKDCPHIYDVMGCYWNQPANYGSGVFESCNGDKTLPAGVYGTSTWSQGVKPTPSGHPAAASSQCVKQSTIKISPVGSTTTSTTTATTTSTSSTTTSTPVSGKLIRSGNKTNKCIAAASTAKGAAIVIQDCVDGAATQMFTRTGNTLRVAGWCIDVADGNTAKGAKLQAWSCGSGTNVNQQFSYGNQHLTWINSGFARSIDVTNGVFDNGNTLQLWQTSNTTANQLWTL
ncbi:ricin B lectin domain-containing protein [Auriculariales sp. MPI-PUGE-AT-0066]|jgi:hypothetical protein|nr:ricin B lectin domain-containing protein [Auriculariales sp. MPI-PUGE-AT-0066]